MKKLAITALSVGALAVATACATSYYVGGQIEQKITQTAALWSTEDGLTVAVMDYERGVIRSHATTLWSITTEDGTYDVTATHDILQGPWSGGHAAQITTRFQLPEDSEASLVEALQDRAPLEWRTVADWSGATAHQLHSPAFATRFEDGSQLSWGGLNAEWTLSANLDTSKGFAHMPALRVEQERSHMDIHDAKLTFDAHIPMGYTFWTGPTTLKVGKLSLLDPDTAVDMQFTGLQVQGETTRREDLLQSDLSVQLDEFESAELHSRNFAFQMQLKNISAPWFEQWVQWVQTSSDTQELLQQFGEKLPELLASQPELNIPRLSFDSKDGPVSLSAYLHYIGTQPEAFDPSTDLEGQIQTSMPLSMLKLLLSNRVRNDYVELLEHMDREIHTEELEAAVDDGVGKRLETLQSNDFVQLQGDTAQATLRFTKGEFLLNDHPRTLQQLLNIGGSL